APAANPAVTTHEPTATKPRACSPRPHPKIPSAQAIHRRETARLPSRDVADRRQLRRQRPAGRTRPWLATGLRDPSARTSAATTHALALRLSRSPANGLSRDQWSHDACRLTESDSPR